MSGDLGGHSISCWSIPDTCPTQHPGKNVFRYWWTSQWKWAGLPSCWNMNIRIYCNCVISHSCNMLRYVMPVTVPSAKKNGLYTFGLEIVQNTLTLWESFRLVLCIICTKCMLQCNHSLTHVIFQHTKWLLLQSSHFFTTYTSITWWQKCELWWKNNLTPKKFLGCSYYLYRFHKCVSYGFPIINFCNPRVHYEMPCRCHTEMYVCLHIRGLLVSFDFSQYWNIPWKISRTH